VEKPDRTAARLALALWLTGSWVGVVHAAGGDDALFEDDLLFGEIPSVFTASKFEQKVTEAPARTSIVTRKEIQRYGYRFLSEILQSLPGFFLQNDRNYGRLGVRGFSVPGDYNSRILLLVDGHRQNENISDSMDIDDLFVLDVDLIERVEVVRGPGSSLYGSNAFFGVVNVITRDGRGLNGTEVAGSVGSDNTYQGRISHGERLANGVEYLVSGTYHEGDGNGRVYAREFDDPATNNGYYDDNDERQFEQLFGELSFGDFTLQGAFIDREKHVPTGAYETVWNDPNTMTRDKRAYADLKYQTQLEDGAELMARIYYDWYEYFGDYPYDYGPPPDYVIFKDYGEGRWWGTELQWSKQLFERHRVTLGGEYRDSLKQAQKAYDVYDTYLDIDTNDYSWALYAQDEFRVRDDLILSAGIRYDYFDNSGSTTNPRMAVVWSPSQQTTVKAIYGTAFRAPSAYELYYNDGDIFQKAALDLEPETIETYELILEQQLTPALRAVASVYDNSVEDLIAAEIDPADGLLVLDNRGDAQVRGAELELLGHWSNGWRGGVSYAYAEAEDGDGGRLVNSPRHLVKLNLIAPLISDRLSAGLEWQYESSRKTLAAERSDDFSLTNLTLSSEGWVPGLTLSGGVYNLFDEHYSHPGAGEHTQDLLEQDGRTFRLKLQYAF
jgi:iron complex outermembrane receptor protein